MRNLVITALTPLAGPLGGVHPHALTTVSLLAGVAAGAAYAQTEGGPWLRLLGGAPTAGAPWLYLVGGALVALSGIADGLDGIVARRYGLTSVAGDYLDHLTDRFVEVAILGGLALSVNTNRVLGLAVLVIVLLHSYAGTQIEASFARRRYDGAGKPHLFLGLVVVSVLLAAFPDVSWTVGARSWFLQDLLFALLGVACGASLVHRSYGGWKLARAADRNTAS